jgi:hypothetical protein
MPALQHSQPGEHFDIERSAAAKWLVDQPDVLQWVFDAVRNRKLIVFNPETRTWRGKEVR